jgi:hypothetical protein
MAYLGLVPSERSSGASVRRGRITKAGNAHARRVLIEGAWTYRMQARVSRKLLDRLERLPQAVRDVAWKAQLRLCHRYRRLAAAGKPKGGIALTSARTRLAGGGDPVANRQTSRQHLDRQALKRLGVALEMVAQRRAKRLLEAGDLRG